MLIDVWRELGLEGMAQVDLDVHRNRHQPLSALTEMAETVLATVVGRLVSEGRVSIGDGIGGRSGGESGRDASHACPGRLGSHREGGEAGAPVERPPLAGTIAR